MKWYLDNEIGKGTVCITKTIHDETSRKIWDLMADIGHKEKLQPLTIRALVNSSLHRFGKLVKVRFVEDELALLGEAQKMYQDIWTDKAKESKVRTWGRLKRKNPEDDPPTGGDLFILATAAALTKNHDVSILTFDHDFLIFHEEIKSTFGINIVNAGVIPN